MLAAYFVQQCRGVEGVVGGRTIASVIDNDDINSVIFNQCLSKQCFYYYFISFYCI
jgi:hypothetical protein